MLKSGTEVAIAIMMRSTYTVFTKVLKYVFILRIDLRDVQYSARLRVLLKRGLRGKQKERETSPIFLEVQAFGSELNRLQDVAMYKTHYTRNLPFKRYIRGLVVVSG